MGISISTYRNISRILFPLTDLSSSDWRLACICGVLSGNPPFPFFFFFSSSSLTLTLKPPNVSAVGVLLPEVAGVEEAVVAEEEEDSQVSEGESDLTNSLRWREGAAPTCVLTHQYDIYFFLKKSHSNSPALPPRPLPWPP